MKFKNLYMPVVMSCFIALQVACKNEDKPPQDQIIIGGSISNYEEDEFNLTYDELSLLKSTQKEKVEIDSSGNFKIILQLSAPVKGTLNFGRHTAEGRGIYKDINFYVEPGDSLFIEADVNLENDIEGISKTLRFSGSGVANNEYVKLEDEAFNSYPQKVQNNHKFIQLKNPIDYKSSVDSIRDVKLAFLEEFSKEKELSPRLKEFYKDDYINLAVVRKFNYPSSNKGFNDGVEQDLPEDYYDFVDDVRISDDLDEKGLPYLRYTHFFLTNKFQLAKEEGYTGDFVTFIDSELSERPKYVYMAYSLGSNFNPEIYSKFGENSPFKDIADIVKDKYGHLEKMLPGNPAPEVVLTNLDNDTILSTDFYEGKFVYIDFWATWCKPCIREIPDLLKLEDEYHDDNIIFVSISFDEEKETWKNYVEKEGLTGIQLWVDKENKKIYDDGFNITMIPRFVLLDDKGNIISANAPYPSSGNDIRKLLNESLRRPALSIL